jgi:Cu-processing system permease protein
VNITAPLWPTIRVVALHQCREALRSRWLLAYGGALAIGGALLIRLGGTGTAALVSMLNVVLLLVPLVALVLGTASIYSAREFTELLLAQPVSRRALYAGLTAGHAAPLALVTAGGLLMPFVLLRAVDPELVATLLLFLLISILLTAVFSALAFLISVLVHDRVRGLSVAILVWLSLAVLYDGIVLLLVTVFREWPLERPLLVAMAGNPIDLARTLLLLRLDVSALMGYTGAVFQQTVGTPRGMVGCVLLLTVWATLPWWLGARAYDRRDF